MHAGVPGPGEILAGKYRVERVLGAGGMGIVLAATHVTLQELVAVKVLLPELAASSEAVARFVREARAACRIKSEHVARVSDVGTLESGLPYLVMEYLEGHDLSQRLSEQGRLPPSEAVGFVLQACEAVVEAHVLGIVHRDLKPANLFLMHRSDGSACIKVLDFGVSKVTHPKTSKASAGLTDSAAVMGSPLYMSPEQLRAARSVDQRADIWALGVILYELISGRPPFFGETLPEVSVKIAVDPPESLRSNRRDVPSALEAVIVRCLHKDREKRFRDIGELATALAPFGPDGASVSAQRVRRILEGAKRAPVDGSEPRSSSSVSGVSSPLRTSGRWRRQGAWGLLCAVAVGALVGGLHGRESVVPHPTASSVVRGPAVAVVQVLPVAPSPVIAESVGPFVEPVNPEDLPLIPASAVSPSEGTPSPSARSAGPSGPSLAAVTPPFSKASEPAKAVVELMSAPGGFVLVNGRPLGATPVKVSLPPGDHVAKFVRDGAAVSRRFTVVAGRSSVIQVSSDDFEIANPYR